jgi:hypothetical protein
MSLRTLGIVVLAYVGIVVVFESLIGSLQPGGEGTIVLTTRDASGAAHERVVSGLESGGTLYVAANHWPRAWYQRALANPEVQVTVDGAKRDYLAVPVTGADHDRIATEKAIPTAMRFLMGFPPRKFLRLDPR